MGDHVHGQIPPIVRNYDELTTLVKSTFVSYREQTVNGLPAPTRTAPSQPSGA